MRLITLPERDVRLYLPPENVYGILAAPPCTHLAISGVRWWKTKGIEKLYEGLALVDACMRIILISKPKFWVLENSVGRLVHYLGKPKMYFQPWEYGDPYTKKTCLWGDFNVPIKTPCEPIVRKKGHNSPLEYWYPSKMHLLPPSKDRKTLRAITPQGFAKAFYEVNK